jgi:UDP-N-acetylmuramoyl-tripeptide--D-alanyl-D-alanine ligase
MGFSSYQYGIYSISSLSGAHVVLQCSRVVLGLCIDTRQDIQDKLFVALQGEHSNGHHFIQTAIEHGASAILADKAHEKMAYRLCKGRNVGLLICSNPLRAMQRLAHQYVAQFPQVQYVGITGSVGKSTTKQALSAILATKGNVVATPGNYNSEIGLALSLLQVDSCTDYGVFEMGIDHKGEMDSHLSMIQPASSIITNISYSHASKMGRLKDIAQEKGKIFHDHLEKGYVSSSILYGHLLQKKAPVPLTFFDKSHLDVSFDGLNGSLLTLHEHTVALPLIAPYQIEDIAAAIAVARDYGLTDKDICEGLANFIPLMGRGTVVDGPITVIEDCYNASPASTEGILGYLGGLHWIGGKKAVLGSMMELGRYAKNAHRNIGRLLSTLSLDTIFLYGEDMEEAYRYLYDAKYAGKVYFSDDFSHIRDAVVCDRQKGNLFLLKGSRAMEMERLVPVIQGSLS